MIEYVCDTALAYTSADFEHWTVGFGTLLLGIGTIGIAYGAVKKIPEKIQATHKDPVTVKLYQKVVYRAFQEVQASEEGMPFSLPKDLEQLTDLLLDKYPFIGDREAVATILDDLMLDGYFKTVKGNAVVVETAKWDTKTRKPLSPSVEHISKRGD